MIMQRFVRFQTTTQPPLKSAFRAVNLCSGARYTVLTASRGGINLTEDGARRKWGVQRGFCASAGRHALDLPRFCAGRSRKRATHLQGAEEVSHLRRGVLSDDRVIFRAVSRDELRGAMAERVAVIERLRSPACDEDFRALARLLVETVESGAAVSFLLPLAMERAEAWWRSTVAAAHAGAVFLVAREGDEIVGTVQMHPAWAPNQPDRADVAKLMVDRRRRGSGLGRRLMGAVEDAAREGGMRLLTLDAKRGGAAEALYRRLGWTQVGTIPRFAFDPDGRTLHDTVIFYKELETIEGTGRGNAAAPDLR